MPIVGDRRTHLSLAVGAPACCAFLALLASCGRPLGAVFDRPPSAGLPEAVRDAPWPMEGRCPGRTFFTPVIGPRQPEVVWTVPEATFFLGVSAVVDSDETVYLLTGSGDPMGGGSLAAIDGSGTLLWRSDLDEPVFGAPALGGQGRIFVSLPYSLAALGMDGGDRGEVPYGNWPPAPADFLSSGSPVLAWDGGVLASTFRFVASVDTSLSVAWESEWTDPVRTGATVDVEGRALVLADAGWDLGYPALGLVRYDGQGAAEELAVLEGDRTGSVAVDVNSTIYVATVEPHPQGEQRVLAYALSAGGELLWTFEDRKMDDSFPALALGLGPSVHLAWNDETDRGRVVELAPDGSRQFDTALDGRVSGPMIVDGEGWSYLGRCGPSGAARVWAVDRLGELRWSLRLPGDGSCARILAMGGAGRLYVAAGGALVAIGEPLPR